VQDLVSVDFFTVPTATFRVLFVLPDRDERRRLLSYAGKYVRATGRLFESGGTHAINIGKIEVVPGW
jgi:hypothetical protein